MNLRSIASALSVLLGSAVFIATSAPPVYTISKKELRNIVALSPERSVAEKKVTLTLDPKKIVRRVEKHLREDASVVAIFLEDGAQPPPGLTVEIKYPDGNPTKPAAPSYRWIDRPDAVALTAASVFEYCNWETPCEVEVIVVFSMEGLTEEINIPWELQAYLTGMQPTKNERQKEKAEQAIQVFIE